MGKLARIGIALGQAVPVEGILSLRMPSEIDGVTRLALKHFGFDRIAEKVIAGRPLSVEDAEQVATHATLPVLLKLVELKRVSHDVVEPLPAVLLPVRRWLTRFGIPRTVELALQTLEHLPYPRMRVSLEWPDFAAFTETLEIVKAIATVRKGLVFVGPSLEEVVSALRSSCGSVPVDDQHRAVEAALHAMREAGFQHLRATESRRTIKFLTEHGFPGCLISEVDRDPSARGLVHELCEIRRLIGDGVYVETWCPGVSKQVAGYTDLLLLRALALGTLFLDEVPFRRASSRFFSAEGFEFARMCGANDFGFGAVDQRTARFLGLQSLRVLQQQMTPALPALIS